MPTAIIGVGRIGTAVATHLTEGGESVVLAASTPAPAEQLARELGPSASAAGVADAIERADAIVFAVWFDTLKELVRQNAARLGGKVVIGSVEPHRRKRRRRRRNSADQPARLAHQAELVPGHHRRPDDPPSAARDVATGGR